MIASRCLFAQPKTYNVFIFRLHVIFLVRKTTEITSYLWKTGANFSDDIFQRALFGKNLDWIKVKSLIKSNNYDDMLLTFSLHLT